MIQDATLPGTGLPPAVRRVSWILERLLGLGVPVGPLYLLETRGWRTGTARTVPVAVIRFGGRRWLGSVFGVAEVDDKRRPVVAMRLRRSFRFIPFVRQAFGATPRDGIAAFQAEAHRHPVFLIDDRLEET